MTEPRRILVTGSITWQNPKTIEAALDLAWKILGEKPDTVLVQGESPYGGADLIAKEYWTALGRPVESHPADFDPETGKMLGKERNAKMIALGVDICLVFLPPLVYPPPTEGFSGTVDCMEQAQAAGIDTVVFREGEDDA